MAGQNLYNRQGLAGWASEVARLFPASLEAEVKAILFWF